MIGLSIFYFVNVAYLLPKCAQIWTHPENVVDYLFVNMVIIKWQIRVGIFKYIVYPFEYRLAVGYPTDSLQPKD